EISHPDTGADPDAVGRIAGTEDATPLVFRVAVHPQAYLQLDDVVVTSREVPGAGAVTVAGVVTEVTARHEGGQVATTRAEPEVWVPPQPGSAVYRAVDEQRDRALCFDRMERKVAVGLG